MKKDSPNVKRKKPRIGDIVQIHTKKGYAYAQLTHTSDICGYLLRVLPGLFNEPIQDYRQIKDATELFCTFVFREDLNDPPVTRTVGNEGVPERCQPFPLFRDGVRDPQTAQVKTWWLWDGETSWPIGDLNEQQKSLPVREICTSDILARKIEEGWLPIREI